MFTLWLKVQYSRKKFNVYRIADSDADKKNYQNQFSCQYNHTLHFLKNQRNNIIIIKFSELILFFCSIHFNGENNQYKDKLI